MSDAEWREARIDDVAILVKRGRAPAYADSGVRVVNQKVIRSENLMDWGFARRTDTDAKPIPEWAMLEPTDVVVCSTGRGTLGRAALVGPLRGPTSADSHVCIVRPDQASVLPTYLGIVLSTLRSTFESIQSGSTSQTELSPSALGGVAIPLPPLPVQRRIVDVVGALDAHIANLHTEADNVAWLANQTLLVALNSPTSLQTALGDCMRLDLDRGLVQEETKYQIFGVLNRGQGLVGKGVITGADTGYAHLNRVRVGQVVMRRLTAWEGPIAVVPSEFDGYFGSAEFPSFTLDSARLLPAFMSHVCGWSGLWSEMKQNVTGSVQRRKRLNPEQLLSVRIPVPPLEEQRLSADALDALKWNALALRREAQCAAGLRIRLLKALLSREVEIPEAYDALLVGVA